MIYFFIIAIVLLGLKELIPLIKKKMIKEGIMVSAILFFSLFTIVGKEINIPSIFEILYKLVTPLSKQIFK